MDTPRLRDLRPGDLGWIVHSQGHANLRLGALIARMFGKDDLVNQVWDLQLPSDAA